MTIDEATPGYGQPGCRGYEPPMRRDETMTTPDAVVAAVEQALKEYRETIADLAALERRATAAEAERDRLRVLLQGRRYPTETPAFLRWIADWLVNVHGESPNVDYVLSLRQRADDIDTALAESEATNG